MKITFITSKLNFETSGGSVIELDLKIKTMLALGADVKVITVFPEENKTPSALPYEIAEEKITSKRLLSIQIGIFKILKKYSSKTDAFHLDGHLFLYGAGLYRLLGGQKPVVAHFNRELVCWTESRSWYLPKSSQERNILRNVKRKLRFFLEQYLGVPIARKIDILTFANSVLKTTYENFGLRKKTGSMVLPDFFDYKSILRVAATDQAEYANKTKNKIKDLVLLYSGRMVPGRGFDLILKAFSSIKDKNRFRLILGGDGPEKEAIHQLAGDLNIKDCVEFLGWIPKTELYEYFKKADVFLMPKLMRLDFNSITLLEAMSFGLPSVIPAGGTLAWVAGDSALQYKDEDFKDFADKIIELADNPELRIRLSNNCLKKLSDPALDFEENAKVLLKTLSQIE